MWQHIFILLVLFLAACSGETAVVPTPAPITVANAATVTEIGQGSYQSPYKLLWNPDLNALMVGHQGGVSLLNADGTNGGLYMSTTDEEITGTIDFSLGGTLAALLPDGQSVQLYVMESGIEIGALTNFGVASNLHVSGDGGTVALTSADEVAVSMWNVETQQEEYRLDGLETAVSDYHVVFSDDWQTMIWIIGDTVQLQAVDSGDMGPRFEQNDRVQVVALSPDNVLAVATAGTLQGEDLPIVKLWDAVTSSDLDAFELPIEAMSLAFSPNGSLLATGDQDGTIMLWDVANQEEVATLTGHANMVQHLTFSQDGRLLASSGADTVRIWGVK